MKKKIKIQNTAGFFSYRYGKSFMHSLNPTLKVLLMVFLAAAAFFVPAKAALLLWILLTAFSFFVLKFSPKEILSDITPGIVYGLVFYAVSVLLNITEGARSAKEIFAYREQYLTTFLHLALSLEISSVFYRTTSIPQFSQGFRSIESFFTRKDETPFATSLSLTLTFIPRVTVFWKRCSEAWKARCGKKNARRIRVLTPVLFRISMNEAYTKALAMQNRM